MPGTTTVLGLTTFQASDTIDLVTHVSTGLAQRVEDVLTGAANPAGSVTLAFGTITTDRGLKLTATLNAAGVTFVPLDLNLTRTAAAAASRLVRVRQDGNAIFEVASVASAATGIGITPAAAGSRVGLAAISTGTNEGLDIDAKGSGTIRLGNTSTGGVVVTQGGVAVTAGGATVGGTVAVTPTGDDGLTISRAAGNNRHIAFHTAGSQRWKLGAESTAESGADAGSPFAIHAYDDAGAFLGSALTVVRATRVVTFPTGIVVTTGGASIIGTSNVDGVLTAASGTGMGAGGSASARLRLSSVANFGIYFGSGAPTVSAAQGSLYLRSDGSSGSTRAYINTDGGTTWTSITTAA